jgi:YVTN family beta-propeller protein
VQTALKRGPLAFVSNFSGGTVSVLDTASNTEIAKIPANSPTGIAIAGGGRTVFVSNPRSLATIEEVLVIDTLALLANLANPALAIAARVPVQDNPLGLALSPDEALLAVANANSDTLSLIDTATRQVTQNVAVGDGPEEVAITPDGRTALVSNVNGRSVSIVDLSLPAVRATVQVGNDPGDIAITPDGAFAYVANSGSSSVSVIAIATAGVVTTINAGMTPEGVALAPDGRLYVANTGGNSITIIDARPVEGGGPGTAVLGTVSLPRAADGPFRIAFSADGAAGYVTNTRSDNVAVIDTAIVLTDPSNAVPLTVRTGAFPHTVAVSEIAATELQAQP